MAFAAVGTAPPTCDAPVPVLNSAIPSSQQVSLSWSSAPGAGGYNIYYDVEGKSDWIADLGLATTYTDTGLTNGTPYCYKVTSYNSNCESGFSNVSCATPNAAGQRTSSVSVLETGKWVTEGRGKTVTTSFVVGSVFNAGDNIVIRALVVGETSSPLQGAVVDILISGPESLQLISAPTDIDGWTEVSWQTQPPNKKGVGGTTTGNYSATVTNVTATGYDWDNVATSVSFSLQ